MTWYRDFGLTEQILCAAFVVFYALYCYRLIRIGRSFNTPVSILLIKLFLRTAMFALLIVAILGPSIGDSKREVRSEGKDIIMCVDLSKSMDAFDIQPSRLEKVKYEMKKIVSAFNSDRIGIIIFSSEAFMQSPLTYDQNALNLFIEAMNSSLVPASGTDFGPPLRMAVKKMEDEEVSGPLEAKSKVIILISDGEDFGDNADEAAKEIQKQNIKLFTLGVGTEEGGKIYAANGFKKDRQGNTVVSKLNSKELRALAAKTDGQYFEINDKQNDVSRLISTINKIEGQLRDSRMVDVTANRYYYFLGMAIILFFIDVLVRIKTITI